MQATTLSLGIFLGFLSLLMSRSPVAAWEICRTCADPHRFEYPGVGLDLTMDYGTSAVSFPNGSIVSVARIEGNPQYRSLMRGLAQGTYSPGNNIPGYHHTILATSLSRQLRQWQTPTLPPLHAMLRALQAATEAYLDKPLNTTDIAVPYNFFETRSDLFDLEIHRMGLRRTLGGYPSPLKAAMWAQRALWDYSELADVDDTRLILAVDYSQSVLTAGLFSNDVGVLEEHRFEQDLDVGADASPSHLPWSKELLRKRRELLEEVIRLPITDARFELPDKISEIVLIGDRTQDAELLEFLEDILGPAMVARVCSVQDYEKANPIITAARSMATAAKVSIDEGEQNCLPWDCMGWWDKWIGL